MSSTIDILDDSSDDEIPGPSGLTATGTARASASGTSSSTTGNIAHLHQSIRLDNSSSTIRGIVSPNPNATRGSIPGSASTRQPAKKKAKTKPTKAYSLIWICTHGKGQRRSWRQKDLKIMGVYPSKSAAEEAKRNIMSQHECCGHGDIVVGGTWEDEIDLVIRESPLHL